MAAKRQLRPAPARDPMIRQLPEGRKFPRELAGNQASERCTSFGKYPRRAAIRSCGQSSASNLLKGPAKLKGGVKAKSSISGHEGEPAISILSAVFLPKRRDSDCWTGSAAPVRIPPLPQAVQVTLCRARNRPGGPGPVLIYSTVRFPGAFIRPPIVLLALTAGPSSGPSSLPLFNTSSLVAPRSEHGSSRTATLSARFASRNA